MIAPERFYQWLSKENVLSDQKDKAYAALDTSNGIKESLPHLVLKVQTQDELIACVRLCLEAKTPVVIRGAGTGKSGGAIAGNQSVVIDISGLNRIICIDKTNLLAEVEPGVILSHLKRAVQVHGLFYPPDPASQNYCTMGGTMAENAAGPSTLKYGTTRNYILGGTAIMGTGELFDFGKRCPKGVAGFDLASLLCGSEGTLAVFTKLIVRLIPHPKSIACGVFYFDDQDHALSAVNKVLTSGHNPRTLEYIDHACLEALSTLKPFAHPGRAALIIECDAYHDDALAELLAIGHTLKPYTKEMSLFISKKELDAIWQLRSSLSDACTHYLGHKLSEDIAVPLGRLVDLQRATKNLSKPPHLIVGLFGHAGDGNLHVQIMFATKELTSLAQEICHKVLLIAVGLGGTIAAEHGIGLKKKDALSLEQSECLIEVQKRIKKAFDPYNLLNPGKIFDV